MGQNPFIMNKDIDLFKFVQVIFPQPVYPLSLPSSNRKCTCD